MTNYRGQTALITGASSGIGAAFAEDLAKRGMNLVLVARRADRLEQIATELRNAYGVRIEVFPYDLGVEHSAEQIRLEVERRGLQIDMLINNAGFGSHGYFEELASANDHQQVMVNVVALMDLTHAFVPQILAKKGAIINVASTVAFQPTPYMATYGATKAFVISFSAALAEEYRGRGMKVLALCPGATDTGFFDVVGGDSMAMAGKRVPAQVVATAMRGLERGQSVVIDGVANTVMAVIAKRLSFSLGARAAMFITKPVNKLGSQAKGA